MTAEQSARHAELDLRLDRIREAFRDSIGITPEAIKEGKAIVREMIEIEQSDSTRALEIHKAIIEPMMEQVDA